MSRPEITYEVVVLRDFTDEHRVIAPGEPGPESGWWFQEYQWDNYIFRCEDGAPVELIGSDGGEPEDQTLRRDWSWVPTALAAAYRLGFEHGRSE